MQKKKIISFLESIGLSNAEAELYTASVTHGPLSVQRLSENSTIKRTTIYPLLSSLKQRGLMSEETRNGKKVLVATHPDILNQMLAQKFDSIKEVVPELSHLYTHGRDGEKVYVYNKESQILAAYTKLIGSLSYKDEYLVITDQAKWKEADEVLFKKVMELRLKKKLKTRVLMTRTKVSDYFEKYQKNYDMQVRLLPDPTILETNIVITKQHVLMQRLGTPTSATMIENVSIVATHREIFELLWNSLEDK